jgi:hypothetical protein
MRGCPDQVYDAHYIDCNKLGLYLDGSDNSIASTLEKPKDLSSPLYNRKLPRLMQVPRVILGCSHLPTRAHGGLMFKN